ncbi:MULTISPECIES: SMI1/KNR4 family protein [Pasteurellaceae]|nr:SMI1/KNR4 family protein [Pasteurella atlantica]MDP8036990.1 SMI1/KNR4 family protein [Pasteurella atlantica]MDP8055397.1 SMI1/KNR4 family protein [Pasteurella atlantica]MDP8057351.1 SMI1/KNR4 family protein [Pasteurella atlantica]MDP8059296.1 SMI1/KNR4 family protein [Pasteurella atlantica]MDP8063335.1 SMI1/KNR4 family protein [Pasteurella atlantica]
MDCEWAEKEYVSKPVTEELVVEIEKELGYKLPLSYIELMKIQNGGIPNRACYPTTEATSWAEDHIAITGMFGIGKEKNSSLCGEYGSEFWSKEWGYPKIGVYICDCPSAGHDMIALDYTECGSQGEPKVVHIDQEHNYKVTFLAESFEEFIQNLKSDEEFENNDSDENSGSISESFSDDF